MNTDLANVNSSADVNKQPKTGGRLKTSRRSARIMMMQSLYCYQLNKSSLQDILHYIQQLYVHDKYRYYFKLVPDMDFVNSNLSYAINNFDKMLDLYRNFSFRKIEQINYIEKAILVVAATEMYNTKTDAKVIINEAIEVAKSYGGSDSYIFINSVLHKLSVNCK